MLEEKNIVEKKFSTLELPLAVFLELHGIPAELEINNGRVIFTFQVSDRVYTLANLYNSNELVPITDYIAIYKILKSKMFSLKASYKGVDRVS